MRIQTIDELEQLYGHPAETSTVKVTSEIIPEYRDYIAASPFVAFATSGSEGLDCSPRGDAPGFVRIVDSKTLQMPDRRGNNRVDSLRNVVRDPRVALLFLLPGLGTTIRVNGRAHLSTDAELCASFAINGKLPRCVVVVDVDEVYFQCARALVRSDLWNPDKHRDASEFASIGSILERLSDRRIDGDAYDQEWPERSRKTLW